MILGYSIPPAVADELRALEQQLATDEADAAPFTTDRASCACGALILLEAEDVVEEPDCDPVMLHTPLLCFLLDDEAE